MVLQSAHGFRWIAEVAARMANQFQANQHRIAYGFIASRDGEYCLISKLGPEKVKLQIAHADNNTSIWEKSRQPEN